MSDRDPFLEPIPTVAEGIEKDIDYWTGRLGEGQAGSDWEYSVQTRLAKLNRAKQRLSSNTGSGPLAAQTPRTPKDLDVFISHSSRDEEIAKRLITLIRSALNLPATSIRCTSVDGYRLPTGISTDERLRQEIHDSVAFIALLTPNSLSSVYVLFELGARWGAGRRLFPLLSGDRPQNLLRGPLAALNALSCENEGQLLQFVDDLAVALGRARESPAVYRKCILELVEATSVSLSHAQPGGLVLKGEIGSSAKWAAAWVDLAIPRDFKKGDRLRLTLGGSGRPGKRAAEKVLVRLLEMGDDAGEPVGIITPTGMLVPEDRTIEVSVPANFSEVVSISVHGGAKAWNQFLGEGNGLPTLTMVELITSNPA